MRIRPELVRAGVATVLLATALASSTGPLPHSSGDAYVLSTTFSDTRQLLRDDGWCHHCG